MKARVFQVQKFLLAIFLVMACVILRFFLSSSNSPYHFSVQAGEYQVICPCVPCSDDNLFEYLHFAFYYSFNRVVVLMPPVSSLIFSMLVEYRN